MPHPLRGLRSAGLVTFAVGVVFAIVGGAAVWVYGACLASAGCRPQAGGFDVGSYAVLLVTGVALVAVATWSRLAERPREFERMAAGALLLPRREEPLP